MTDTNKAIVLHDENGKIFTLTHTVEMAKKSMPNIMAYVSDYTLSETFDIEFDENSLVMVDTGKFTDYVFAKTVNPETGEIYEVYASVWTIY